MNDARQAAHKEDRAVAVRRRYGLAIVAASMLLSWSHSALSTDDCDPAWRARGMCPDQQEQPPTNVEVRNDNSADAEANARSQSESGAEASSSATGGSAVNEGDDSSGQTVSSTHQSAYVAVQRNLPSAVGCFGPVDGGGGDGGKFAFFGFTPLNKDCWSQEVSAGYEDVQIKSRVECGSKWFRNAISFHIRRSDRQQHCVDWMVERYVLGVRYAQQQLDLLELEQLRERTKDKMKQCRAKVDTLQSRHEASVEATRRATVAWQKCLTGK